MHGFLRSFPNIRVDNEENMSFLCLTYVGPICLPKLRINSIYKGHVRARGPQTMARGPDSSPSCFFFSIGTQLCTPVYTLPVAASASQIKSWVVLTETSRPASLNLLTSCLLWKMFDNLYVLKYFIYLFLERGEGREKEKERNINQLPLKCVLTGDQTQNPGMCPDQELNWWPFSLRDSTQPIEPHQSGW